MNCVTICWKFILKMYNIISFIFQLNRIIDVMVNRFIFVQIAWKIGKQKEGLNNSKKKKEKRKHGSYVCALPNGRIFIMNFSCIDASLTKPYLRNTEKCSLFIKISETIIINLKLWRFTLWFLHRWRCAMSWLWVCGCIFSIETDTKTSKCNRFVTAVR